MPKISEDRLERYRRLADKELFDSRNEHVEFNGVNRPAEFGSPAQKG